MPGIIEFKIIKSFVIKVKFKSLLWIKFINALAFVSNSNNYRIICRTVNFLCDAMVYFATDFK